MPLRLTVTTPTRCSDRVTYASLKPLAAPFLATSLLAVVALPPFVRTRIFPRNRITKSPTKVVLKHIVKLRVAKAPVRQERYLYSGRKMIGKNLKQVVFIGVPFVLQLETSEPSSRPRA